MATKKRPPPLKPSSSHDEPDDEQDDEQLEDDLDTDDTHEQEPKPLQRHGAAATLAGNTRAELEHNAGATPEHAPDPFTRPNKCQCTEQPCPCMCHRGGAPAAFALRPHRPKGPQQVLSVDVGGGKIVGVPVCWTPEQVNEALSKHANGVIDFKTLNRPGYQHMGSPAELAWFKGRVRELANGKR